MRRVLSFALLLLLLLFASTALAEGALTNSAVLSLVELGLGDDAVIAKINQAESVDFALDTDDLIALKEAGASGPVITAMLKRATPAQAAPAPANKGARVSLVDSSGVRALVGVTGSYRYESRLVAMITYMDMDGLASELKSGDARPTFLVRSENNPSGTFFLAYARPYAKKGKREVKGGTVSAFGGGNVMRPHEAWTIDYEAEQTSPGLWTLKPLMDLGGGEFAIWAVGDSMMSAVTLYDFAIEGHPSLAPWDQDDGKRKKGKRKR